VNLRRKLVCGCGIIKSQFAASQLLGLSQEYLLRAYFVGNLIRLREMLEVPLPNEGEMPLEQFK
jgi:hypothetical protein